MVAFHDLRDALRCLRHARGDHFFGSRKLDSRFVSDVMLIEVSPFNRVNKMASNGYKIPFIGYTSGKVFVSSERELEAPLMRDVLASLGEIYSFEMVEQDNVKVAVCEYFDRRRVTDVIESMNGRDMFVLSSVTKLI
jgi:hypothetical protein